MTTELDTIKIDNSTTHITVETPDNWKCERKNCNMDAKHNHGTYLSAQEDEKTAV